MYEGDRLSSPSLGIAYPLVHMYTQVGLGGLTSITHSFHLRHPMRNTSCHWWHQCNLGSVLSSMHLLMYYPSFIPMFLMTVNILKRVRERCLEVEFPSFQKEMSLEWLDRWDLGPVLHGHRSRIDRHQLAGSAEMEFSYRITFGNTSRRSPKSICPERKLAFSFFI